MEGHKNDDEMIVGIEIERLRDFKDHPFRIKEDQDMQMLMESIERYGILNPLIVRPVPEGVYEIVSGHRRKYAASMLGYRKVPVIIRVLEDDEAVISMVEANVHREHILPSEKAFALKMKYEAMLRTAGDDHGRNAEIKLSEKAKAMLIPLRDQHGFRHVLYQPQLILLNN